MESSGTMSSGRSLGDDRAWKLENPFSFRVLQIFTGVGVGCGVGIGVGKPIYLGSIPGFQQVLSATQGAMDVFSGAGRHVNSNLKRLGVKNIEAGIGCGVGIGHGFGVGLALKPGVAHKLQIFIGSMIEKIMKKIGPIPGLPLLESPNKNTEASSAGTGGNSRTSMSSVLQFKSQPVEDEVSHVNSSEAVVETHTERVVKSFLDNPAFKTDEQSEVDELVKKLQSENNVLQLLLRHERIIDELMEENEKLRKILVEDLKVSPGKIERHRGEFSESIERRRGRRRWAR